MSPATTGRRRMAQRKPSSSICLSVVLVLACLAVVGLAGCRPKPPEITSFAVSPSLGDTGGFTILGDAAVFSVTAKNTVKVEFYLAATGTGQEGQLMHTDATGQDGFLWTWVVPEFTMGHVWAKAYNGPGESVQSELIGVYREGGSGG